MPKDRRSFFERLAGSISSYEEEAPEEEVVVRPPKDDQHISVKDEDKEEPFEESDAWAKEKEIEEDEGQLTVDVYQTPTHIIIQSTVAGVKPEDLDVSITQDMITLKGTREHQKEMNGRDYYYQELYWGSFSRSILLPQEVDSESAEASLKNGLLTIKLPKLDKNRMQKLRIKTNGD